jgi:hypothetical protein
MKTYHYFSLVFGLIFAGHAFAENTKTNEWGAVACNAQMSIALKEPNKEIKTNHSVNLTIHIKTVSTNQASYFIIYSFPTDYSWEIISPSGKSISSKESVPMNAISSMTVPLDQYPNWECEFNLSSVCNFNEIGTYKIIAKKEVFVISPAHKKGEIVSNPLDIIISR